jgi:hypothetical protein
MGIMIYDTCVAVYRYASQVMASRVPFNPQTHLAGGNQVVSSFNGEVFDIKSFNSQRLFLGGKGLHLSEKNTILNIMPLPLSGCYKERIIGTSGQ